MDFYNGIWEFGSTALEDVGYVFDQLDDFLSFPMVAGSKLSDTYGRKADEMHDDGY